MKVLIFYATAGGGHKSAALAIERYFLENMPGCTAKAVNAMAVVGSFENYVYSQGYHFLATKTPDIFGLLYRATNQPSFLENAMNSVTGLLSRRLLRYIKEENPDVIISAYPFATGMVSILKEKGKLDLPLVCVMTDYGPHRAWIGAGVDAYMVATPDMIPEMERMGAPANLIHPVGIPVRQEFYSAEDRGNLRMRLGLSPDLPTLLVMAGSFGVKNIIGIYRRLVKLPQTFQIIVITGNNKRLYRAFRMETIHSEKPTKLVQFTREVENYMHASDLLITKPGGLTTSEALASDLPLCVFDAIPGQEEDNASFLMVHGMAVKLEKKTSADTVGSLLEDTARLQRMRKACHEFDASGSLPSIAALSVKLAKTHAEKKQCEA